MTLLTRGAFLLLQLPACGLRQTYPYVSLNAQSGPHMQKVICSLAGLLRWLRFLLVGCWGVGGCFPTQMKSKTSPAHLRKPIDVQITRYTIISQFSLEPRLLNALHRQLCYVILLDLASLQSYLCYRFSQLLVNSNSVSLANTVETRQHRTHQQHCMYLVYYTKLHGCAELLPLMLAAA